MAKISTTTPAGNTGGGGGGFIQKSLQPGITKCVIHGIKLEKAPFIKERDGYFLTLSLEGPEQGGTFEGFPKVFGDNAGEKFKGQQSFVKSSTWDYYDGKTGNGYDCTVQDSVLGFLQELCAELGITKWLTSINGKYDTIQEIVQAFDREKPFAGIWINYLLGSRVYQNKGGYDAHDLHLIRSSKEGKGFCGDLAQVLPFNKDKHIYRPKPKALTEGFEGGEQKKTTGINTTNKVSETPITDEMNREAGTKVQENANTASNQTKQEFLQEMQEAGNKVEEKVSDIVTADNSEKLPFELD